MLSPAHPFQLALGLSVWIVWFGAIYGGLTLACVFAAPPVERGPLTWINGLLLLSAVLVSLLLLYWGWRCWHWTTAEATAAERMIARVGAGLHVAAAVATVGVGATVLVLPPCV